ncbi:hypothetical protein LSH36_352g03031 [Paralvinella palmiformis]|uniref:DNA-directed RNA polymerase III subunit n=1 Tax=Paralvinella palmiformis TaxID=53620 RepID=A0AAD9JEP5_9ANNE|nr:hypothetical protein LSH36_352g03031 [Paralvinella palmiformis]
MAGRGGRGRGRGKNISFNVESLGFGRGEALPTPILQPPPTYPVPQFKCLPLVTSEEQDYLITLKHDLRMAMQDSPYYIKPQQKKCDIERYSDKYHVSKHDKWQPDWQRLPLELQQKKKKLIKKTQVVKKQQTVDISEKLKVLEEKEVRGDEEVEVEEEEEEKKPEEGEELEEYDESDLEEETDYNLTYFDNGENDEEDDDLDEGPIY